MIYLAIVLGILVLFDSLSMFFYPRDAFGNDGCACDSDRMRR